MVDEVFGASRVEGSTMLPEVGHEPAEVAPIRLHGGG
jgi:hypothetical protein